jgi:predicted Rossmann-fold nucleotide-binding protein
VVVAALGCISSRNAPHPNDVVLTGCGFAALEAAVKAATSLATVVVAAAPTIIRSARCTDAAEGVVGFVVGSSKVGAARRVALEQDAEAVVASSGSARWAVIAAS